MKQKEKVFLSRLNNLRNNSSYSIIKLNQLNKLFKAAIEKNDKNLQNNIKRINYFLENKDKYFNSLIQNFKSYQKISGTFNYQKIVSFTNLKKELDKLIHKHDSINEILNIIHNHHDYLFFFKHLLNELFIQIKFKYKNFFLWFKFANASLENEYAKINELFVTANKSLHNAKFDELKNNYIFICHKLKSLIYTLPYLWIIWNIKFKWINNQLFLIRSITKKYGICNYLQEKNKEFKDLDNSLFKKSINFNYLKLNQIINFFFKLEYDLNLFLFNLELKLDLYKKNKKIFPILFSQLLKKFNYLKDVFVFFSKKLFFIKKFNSQMINIKNSLKKCKNLILVFLDEGKTKFPEILFISKQSKKIMTFISVINIEIQTTINRIIQEYNYFFYFQKMLNDIKSYLVFLCKYLGQFSDSVLDNKILDLFTFIPKLNKISLILNKTNFKSNNNHKVYKYIIYYYKNVKEIYFYISKFKSKLNNQRKTLLKLYNDMKTLPNYKVIDLKNILQANELFKNKKYVNVDKILKKYT